MDIAARSGPDCDQPAKMAENSIQNDVYCSAFPGNEAVTVGPAVEVVDVVAVSIATGLELGEPIKCEGLELCGEAAVLKLLFIAVHG